eukprot:8271570-Alexandrium_andersonii.AAC.1
MGHQSCGRRCSCGSPRGRAQERCAMTVSGVARMLQAHTRAGHCATHTTMQSVRAAVAAKHRSALSSTLPCTCVCVNR